MFKIVFRDSSLYMKQLPWFCRLLLINSSVYRIGCVTNFCITWQNCCTSSKTAVVNIKAFKHLIMSHQGERKLNVCWTSTNNKKSKVFLRTLCAFPILVQFSKIKSCKSGCAPASPAAHFLCSTARIRQDISAAAICSCKLLWRIDEYVLLPCFNAQHGVFAVINCCVVALSLFSSDSTTWSTDSLYSVQRHIK